MKATFFVLLLIFISVFSIADKPEKLKYLKFKDKDKWGLCDTKGLVKISAKYENILGFNNNFFIITGPGKCLIMDINEKLIEELKTNIKEIEFLNSGSFMMNDSSGVYAISSDGKLKFKTNKLYEAKEKSELLLVYESKDKKSDENLTLNIYESKTLKFIKSYPLINKRDFDYHEISDSLKFFTVQYSGNNNELFIDILDKNGKTIAEKICDPDKPKTEWFYKNVSNLQNIRENYLMKKIASEYYSGKVPQDIIKNFTGITIVDSTKTCEIIDLYGKKIKSFESCTKVEEITYKGTKNISHFAFEKYMAQTKKKIYCLMTRDYNLTDYFIDAYDKPDKFLSCINLQKFAFFNIPENKFEIELDHNMNNNSGSEDLIAKVLSDNLFAYKEGPSYCVMNINSKKKLLNFIPQFPGLVRIISCKVRDENNLKQITFELSFKFKRQKDTIEKDSVFYFLRNSEGTYYSSNEKNISRIYLSKAFNDIESEPANIKLPFYSVNYTKHDDSLIVFDTADNIMIRSVKKDLYCVGERYIGVSNGNTSDLYDLKFKLLKKNIDGIIMAVINGNLGEYISLKDHFYYYTTGGKSKKIFSEYELAGLPKEYRILPDSSNRVYPPKINHAQKTGNKILLYLIQSSRYKLSLFDIQTNKLENCKLDYEDAFDQLFKIDTSLFVKRFKLISKSDSYSSCFGTISSMFSDTLNYLYDDYDNMLEKIKFDIPEMHAFENKRKHSVKYIGTFNKIYYTFPDGFEVDELDFGIKYIGNQGESFMMLDPVTNKIIPDFYSKFVTSYIDNLFIVTNVKSKKQELIKKTDKGFKKLCSGNFTNYVPVESSFNQFKDGKLLILDNKSSVVSYNYENGKLAFDTSKYIIAEHGEDLFSGYGTLLILKSKTANSFFVLNLNTYKITKIPSNNYIPEFTYIDGMPVLYTYRNPEKQEGNVDILAIETGELLENINLNAENYFKLNFAGGKMYYSIVNEKGEMHFYDSKEKLVK